MNGPLFLYWNLEVLIFEQRGKPENPEKNLSEQSREPTTNSAHIWYRVRESNRRSHYCAILAHEQPKWIKHPFPGFYLPIINTQLFTAARKNMKRKR